MIGQICTKPVVTIAPDAPVRDAARLMRAKNVGAVVIVNTGKPIGIVTDRDITVSVVAAGSDPATTKVASIMRRNPSVVRADQGLLDAVKTFSGVGVRRLPVIGKTGKLLGILALDDVLMLLGTEMAHVSTALSRELKRPVAVPAA